MKRVFLTLMVVAATGAACHHSSTTTTPSTDTTTVASPTETDTFNDVLPVGGLLYYTFNVGVYGTVNVSVASIGGPGVPTTVETRLGIGTLSDSGCTTTVTAISKPGVIGVTAAEQPGTYCATIEDVGNLFKSTPFSLTVAHP
jgi:hypothetical protein